MNIDPTKLQEILRLYKQGYVILYDESKNDVITPVKDWCAKDISIILHETDFSYAAIIKRYQEHKDYFRFIHEMNMLSAVNALKEQVKNSDTAELQKTIKDLENENKLLLNENLSLKRTTDEPSYDELKSMYEKLFTENEYLKSKIEARSNKRENRQNSGENSQEQKEYVGNPVATACDKPNALQRVEAEVTHPCRLIYNIMVNGICCCTIYRSFENPPIDGVNQCGAGLIHIDSFSQSVNDILDYDSGTAVVMTGNKCIYQGEVHHGDNYDRIDKIIGELGKELGEDIVSIANYIDFDIIDAPTFIDDLSESIYYTVTFNDGEKPVSVNLIRVDSPIVQVMKECRSFVGKKVKDNSGVLRNIDSIDVRQVYAANSEINNANIAKLRYSIDTQNVYVDEMWHDPASFIDTESEGKLYFVKLCSKTDSTSMGCMVRAVSIDELEKLIIPMFDNTGEYARVYEAETNKFVCVTSAKLKHL